MLFKLILSTEKHHYKLSFDFRLFSGNLEIRDNPITIGLCSGQTGFHGEIDEVRIIAYISSLVRTTHLWNNLHHVRSKPTYLKAK